MYFQMSGSHSTSDLPQNTHPELSCDVFRALSKQRMTRYKSGPFSDSFLRNIFTPSFSQQTLTKLLPCAMHCAGSWGVKKKVRPYSFPQLCRKDRRTKDWDIVWCVRVSWCKQPQEHRGGSQSPGSVSEKTFWRTRKSGLGEEGSRAFR